MCIWLSSASRYEWSRKVLKPRGRPTQAAEETQRLLVISQQVSEGFLIGANSERIFCAVNIAPVSSTTRLAGADDVNMGENKYRYNEKQYNLLDACTEVGP